MLTLRPWAWSDVKSGVMGDTSAGRADEQAATNGARSDATKRRGYGIGRGRA